MGFHYGICVRRERIIRLYFCNETVSIVCKIIGTAVSDDGDPRACRG